MVKEKRNREESGFENKEDRILYIKAKKSLTDGKLNEALTYFKECKNIPGICYCLILNGRFKEAKENLEKIRWDSPFTKWMYYESNMLQRITSENPTYFEIRNFFEQDLEMLFKYKKYDSVNIMLQNSENLVKLNGEVYKYCGRVLLNNNYIEPAKEYINKSLEVCYKDPETHFIKGEIELKTGHKERAIESYKRSIEVNSGYFPSKKRIDKIINK